jgi:hypothetical protein
MPKPRVGDSTRPLRQNQGTRTDPSFVGLPDEDRLRLSVPNCNYPRYVRQPRKKVGVLFGKGQLPRTVKRRGKNLNPSFRHVRFRGVCVMGTSRLISLPKLPKAG